MEKETITHINSLPVPIEELPIRIFLCRQNEWQQLLHNSDADPFFMSWQWMSLWWTNWGGKASDRLSVVAVYLEDELVGVAPLYVCQASYLKGWIPVKRLQSLGTRFNGIGGTRSEYLGTIVKRGLEDTVNSLILKVIIDWRDWDELQSVRLRQT